ncbi:MAG: DUF2281 domain-containing protein [Ignavibacteriales bacterium]|nr:DUF2281 domain-containing protein [Ignavibacteriales bacterium]
MKTIEEKIHELPPELKIEAEQLIDDLIEKHTKREPRKMQLTWAGGLREFRNQFTSVELQHKALEWWGD